MYSLNSVFQKPAHFSPSLNKNKNRRPPEELYNYDLDEDQLGWQWYSPSQTSVPVTFCLETSLHGLKHVGMQKRHVVERIFWFVAFLASVIIAAILIIGMLNDYKQSPIVTLFNPTEKNLDAIPFPAVTICNVNNLQKSKVESLTGKLLLGIKNTTELNKALAMVVDVTYICDSTLTFIDRIMQNTTMKVLSQKIKELISLNMQDIEEYIDPMTTIKKMSQPCHQMILHCIWLGKIRNCGELFQPIQTDYGYCCTYNILPVNLLLNFTKNRKDTRNPEIINSWKEANLDYENLMFTEETINRTFPVRQKYPGRSAGLSFLLDPGLDQYQCSNTDSEGFIMGVNVPLDFPRMKDTGIAIQTDSEIFISLRPEITMTDDSVKYFPVEKRQCYYGNEYKLPHFTKYTVSNCMNECIAKRTLEFCQCSQYFMANGETDELCKPIKYNCTDAVQTWLLENGVNSMCTECLPTCTEIEYQKQVTALKLQKKKVNQLFHNILDRNPKQVSIVHVYFESDSVHPRLRKELTSKTQLLSNAGGLLGLCMGFSVLSLLEIFYYGTIRLCCSFYRNKTINEKNHATLGNMENGHIHEEEEAANLKQSWFSRIFNGASVSMTDIEKRSNKIPGKREDDSKMKNIQDSTTFKTHNHPNKQPVYFQDTFEDQFQRAFLTSFPERGFAYPK